MTEPRVLAKRIRDVLEAFGWECRASGGRIEARELAFRPVDHVFVAGRVADISEQELRDFRPEIVIVEDGPPAERVEQLTRLTKAVPGSPQVTTFSRFVDELWEAPMGASRARADSELQEELPLLDGLSAAGANPQDRHVDQRLTIDGVEISDHRVLDEALAADGGILAISAGAGLGKTELLKVLEWRYAVSYEAALARRSFDPLPPVAVRVPLRGLITLSLDAVARLLADPGSTGGIPALRRIPSGGGLRQLLLSGRLILLLDGLDELAATRERLEEGLKALRELAAGGSRLVITTREGHLATVSPIRSQLSDQAVGRLEPLDPEAAKELLRKYGASALEAGNVVSYLPQEVVGIPLFLLLAYASRRFEPLSSDVQTSQALTLLELVRRFCARDEGRIRLSAAAQMEMLRDLAFWKTFMGQVNPDDAMQLLGLTPGEEGSAFIENPHALLSVSPDGLSFRYAQFEHLFLAKAIAEEWDEERLDRIAQDLSQVRLESATLDYLARLLTPVQVRSAWQRSWDAPLRGTPFLRRNILGIALAMLEDRGSGETPEVRARILSDILGNKNVGELSLAGIAIEQVDLAGWNLQRIKGRGGHIRYCPNLAKAEVDESTYTVDDLEGCEVADREDISESVIQRGRERLANMLDVWINRRVSPPALKPEVAAATRNLDFDGMRALAGAGLAELTRGARGAKFWRWTQRGRDLMPIFLSDPRRDVPELVPVLVALGKQ